MLTFIEPTERVLPLDIRFSLAMVRMQSLEKALHATSSFLEPTRHNLILLELADAYKQVSALYYHIDMDRWKTGYSFQTVQSDV